MSAMAQAVPDVSPAASGDMESYFNSEIEAAGSGGSAVEDVPADEAPVEEEAPPEEVAEPEAPVEEAVAPPEPEIDPEAETFPETKDGKRLFIEKGRFNNVIYPGYKYAQAVREFAPTVEDAQYQHDRATQLRHMQSDFVSSNPQDQEAFLQFWSGAASQDPAERQLMQSNFARIATKIPSMLRDMNPQAYQEMQGSLIADAIEAKYQEAAANPGDASLLQAAQWADWSHNGKYREASAIPKVDPMAAREADLAKREKAIADGNRATAEQQTKQYEGAITNDIHAGVLEAIDGQLKPMLDAFKDRPKLFAALKSNIHQELVAQINGNKQWRQNFDLDKRQVMNSRTRESRDYLVKAYVNKAQSILPKIAAPLIKEATNGIVAASKATHQKLAASETKKGSGSGAPPPKTASTKPGMSMEDELFATLGLRR